MDGESSYESDISESWSLIDINLNEESLSVTDPSESPLLELKNEKIEKTDVSEIEDFVRKCKERNKTEFSRTSDSECGFSNKSEEIESCSGTEENFLRKKSFSDDDGKDDSGDSESIEILEMDGSCQDLEVERLDASVIDQLDNFTYQSDDEESLEGKSNAENRSNNSTVIRRRRRLSNTPENTVHSVNSENKPEKESVEDFRNVTEQPSGANSPVYKHYRNNVVNTVLSLSVGVIFAGVACLAIGHFLGVQDASETAVELAETLKKLQKENAALQSALLTLEMNSKLELPLNQHEVPFEQAPQVSPTKDEVTDFNKAALSADHSGLNSNEWLSKIHSFTRKNMKMVEREEGRDFRGLGKFILDHVHSLNRRMEEGAKFFEDADKKISKYLQRIIKRLSSSQDNIEVLHERLFKLKDSLSNKLSKVQRFPDEIPGSGKQAEKKVPVTELELQTMQWVPESNPEKSLQQDYQKSILFYNFPQPEKYYKNNPGRKEFQLENSNKTQKNEKKVDNKKRKSEEKRKGKKQRKNNWKKEKSKENKEKGEKKRKRAVNKYDKVLKSVEKSRKKDKTGRLTFNQVAFNVTGPQTKKYQKLEEKATKYKRKCKKSKRSKLKKVLLSSLKKGAYSKKKQYPRLCSGPHCFNLTGDWVFKWADGREEFRRIQAVGDWQFDRAKARKDLRVSNYDENWQFKRAVAREYNRWNRAKYEKYFGKDFFHERFSWI